MYLIYPFTSSLADLLRKGELIEKYSKTRLSFILITLKTGIQILTGQKMSKPLRTVLKRPCSVIVSTRVWTSSTAHVERWAGSRLSLMGWGAGSRLSIMTWWAGSRLSLTAWWAGSCLSLMGWWAWSIFVLWVGSSLSIIVWWAWSCLSVLAWRAWYSLSIISWWAESVEDASSQEHRQLSILWS